MNPDYLSPEFAIPAAVVVTVWWLVLEWRANRPG